MSSTVRVKEELIKSAALSQSVSATADALPPFSVPGYRRC